MSLDIDRSLRSCDEQTYGPDYRGHLLEQYKLYLEMADKISERRQTANTYFLTVHTVLVTLLGYGISTLSSKLTAIIWWVSIGVGGMVLCYTWARLIRSYRDLNSGNFKVVHSIEKHLPIQPYKAEWVAVGEGKDSRLYLPFTHIEPIIPWVFFGLYVLLIMAGIITGAVGSCVATESATASFPLGLF